MRQPVADSCPSVIKCDGANAVRFGETAVVVAGFERAGCAFDPCGLGMQRMEMFRGMRAHDRESRYAEQCREMARTGVVADEAVGRRQGLEQMLEVAGLFGQQIHLPAGGAEPRSDGFEFFAAPLAGRLGGAGVDDNLPAGPRGRIRRG